jgi:DNA segregation ATPase FtsK/SpoIIIE-like protein
LAKILSWPTIWPWLWRSGGQIRVEAPIPGRSLVGIEVPNRSLEVVPFAGLWNLRNA